MNVRQSLSLIRIGEKWPAGPGVATVYRIGPRACSRRLLGGPGLDAPVLASPKVVSSATLITNPRQLLQSSLDNTCDSLITVTWHVAESIAIAMSSNHAIITELP